MARVVDLNCARELPPAMRHVEHVLKRRVLALITAEADGTPGIVAPPGFEKALISWLAQVNWKNALRIAEEHDQSEVR